MTGQPQVGGDAAGAVAERERAAAVIVVADGRITTSRALSGKIGWTPRGEEMSCGRPRQPALVAVNGTRNG
jgi:hypothetical protein